MYGCVDQRTPPRNKDCPVTERAEMKLDIKTAISNICEPVSVYENANTFKCCQGYQSSSKVRAFNVLPDDGKNCVAS